MWDLLWKILEWLISWLSPPLHVEVAGFSFDEIRNRPGDPVVVITAFPRCYTAQLSLTNRSNRLVFVKSVVLKGPDAKLSKKAVIGRPLRLEPHEPKDIDVMFPLEDDEKPMSGQFEIEVTPSVGRKTVKPVRL